MAQTMITNTNLIGICNRCRESYTYEGMGERALNDAFISGCRESNEVQIRVFLDKFLSNLNLMTGLKEACTFNNLEIVKIIFKELKTEEEKTHFFRFACMNYNFPVAFWLYEQGVNIYGKD